LNLRIILTTTPGEKSEFVQENTREDQIFTIEVHSMKAYQTALLPSLQQEDPRGFKWPRKVWPKKRSSDERSGLERSRIRKVQIQNILKVRPQKVWKKRSGCKRCISDFSARIGSISMYTVQVEMLGGGGYTFRVSFETSLDLKQPEIGTETETKC
jgi:hypothetical protein